MYWSVDTLAWKASEEYTKTEIKAKVLDTLAPGNIYLMHLGSEATGELLPDLLNQTLLQGYIVLPLSDAITVTY